MSTYEYPQAVIFDWGGTLTPWHTIDLLEPWLAYAQVAAPDQAAALAAALLAAENDVWLQTRGACRSASLATVLSACGVTLDAAAHAAYEAFWEPHTFTDPDVAPLFAGLRERGIKVGVLSNTLWSRSYHEQVFARDRVLELIDGAVYSSEIDWVKPHAQAFHAAMGAVGVVDPSRAVFVGDRPYDDIHGAHEVGMRAVLVPHSSIPEAQRGHVDGSPDAVVQRLAQVLDVLDGWAGKAA